MSHHFDTEVDARQEKLVLASEDPEWVCSPGSDTAPIALPSDRGLHVRPDMAYDAPEVREAPSPITAVVPDAGYVSRSPPIAALSDSTDQTHPKPHGPPLVCGLRRRTFWIAAVVLFILIAGAVVGGAVGGVHANRNQDQDRSPTATSDPNLFTNVTSVSPTTGPSPTGSARPRNNFSLQIWSLPSFTGRTQLFYTPGSYQTAFLARSYIWRPGRYDMNTMEVCSVALCSGSNQVGWRGSSFREQPELPQNETVGVNNVVIECGASFLAPPCPGPLALETFQTAPVLETWMGSLTSSVSTGGNASASQGQTGVTSMTVTVTEEGRRTEAGSSTVSATTPAV